MDMVPPKPINTEIFMSPSGFTFGSYSLSQVSSTSQKRWRQFRSWKMIGGGGGGGGCGCGCGPIFFRRKGFDTKVRGEEDPQAPSVSKFYHPDIMSATKTTDCQTIQDPPYCDISKREKTVMSRHCSSPSALCFYQNHLVSPLLGAPDCFLLSTLYSLTSEKP